MTYAPHIYSLNLLGLMGTILINVVGALFVSKIAHPHNVEIIVHWQNWIKLIAFIWFLKKSIFMEMMKFNN